MEIEDLIKEARNSSETGQRWLYNIYADKLLMYCRRFVTSPEDAEELLLDGFYKFFANIGSYEWKGEAALFKWLQRIMMNECMMYLRRKNGLTIVRESEAADILLPEEAFDNLATTEIFKLIIQLPVGYRTVFSLYVIEGMDHPEIASMLKISEGTSKSQLSRARMLLQKMLLSKDANYATRKQE